MSVPEATHREPTDSHGSDGGSIRARRLAAAPVLIVGAPRSGTTWLQRTLLSLDACCGGQESHALCTIAKVFEDFDRKAAMERPHGLAAHLTREELMEAMRDLWLRAMSAAIEAAPGASVLIEKTPDHAIHLKLADELLPACRVIHLVRDPCDVVASLLAASRRAWGRGWAPATVESAAARWIECVDGAEYAGKKLGPRRFLRVRYETLRDEPHRAFERIVPFLDAGLDAARFADLVSASRTDGAEIPMFGELAGRQAREPDGFASGSPALGAWRRRKVQRLVGARWDRLGDAMDDAK